MLFIAGGEFSPWVEKMLKPFPELSITDLEENFYTYLAEIRVSQNYLSLPFRIKIKISRRKTKNYQSEVKLLTSPSAVVQVVGRVASLEQIYRDKLACLKDRAKPKDLFDLWFASEKLKIPYTPLSLSVKKSEIVRDLRKYLPKDFWPVLERLAK